MTYCSVADAHRTAGITSSEISDADMLEFVKDAETEVDRVTFTTYWAQEATGTADGDYSTTTLSDAGETFTVSAFIGDYLWIIGGTNANELQKISANTATKITVDTAFSAATDATSVYRVIHCGHDPRRDVERISKGTDTLYLRKYPVQYLVSVDIDDTSITTSTIKQLKGGGLQLSTDSETGTWNTQNDYRNDIVYWYGVYNSVFPREIRTLTALKAALYALEAQAGGTHNIPSTYSLPEGSVTIGQAYINIKGTIDMIQKRHNELQKRVRKYPISMAIY